MDETAMSPDIQPHQAVVNGLGETTPLTGDRRPQATASKSTGQFSAPWSIAWGPIVVVGLLLVVLYHGIAVKLLKDWYNLPDFSHGFLIPFFAAFLLWDKRSQ